MSMDDERLPMDAMGDDVAIEPAPTEGQDASQEPANETARDEQGRFAPRGVPNPEAARRREAAERDEWKRKAEEYEAKFTRLDARFADMRALADGDEKQQAAPDPLQDLSSKVDQIAQRFQQQDEQSEIAAAWTQVRQIADADEVRFTQQQPDFPRAVEHYIASRLSEMSALGVDQGQAQTMLQQEAQQLLVSCAQMGRSPAQAIYGLAQARGYQPGVGEQPRPSQQPAQQVIGGRSLGTGAGAGGAAVSAQQIANMSDEDYQAFRRTPEGKRAIQRAMGG